MQQYRWFAAELRAAFDRRVGAVEAHHVARLGVDEVGVLGAACDRGDLEGRSRHDVQALLPPRRSLVLGHRAGSRVRLVVEVIVAVVGPVILAVHVNGTLPWA